MLMTVSNKKNLLKGHNFQFKKKDHAEEVVYYLYKAPQGK
jgi:hypothetical protein